MGPGRDHNHHTGRPAWTWLPLAAMGLAVAVWLFFWTRRLGLSWGLRAPGATVAAGAVALAALLSLVWRPIPIKASTVAVAYLLLFSLLTAATRPLLRLWDLTWLPLLWDSGLLVLALTACLLLYGWLHGRRTRLKQYQLRLSRPLPGREGPGRLRLAVLSDVHMGFSVDEKRLAAQCERLAAARPDLLLILGDLVDDQTQAGQMRAACRLLGQIPCPGGAFFVYGNHDLACHGPQLRFSREELAGELAANHITILDDAWRQAELPGLSQPLLLAGRRDAGFGPERCGGRLALGQLLAQAPAGLPIILLDHQPRQLREAERAGADLLLSGHTHGGQLWPVGWLRAILSPHNPGRGYYRHGRLQVIVTAGLGNRGNRLRSGCTAETLIIDIRGDEGQK